MSSHDFETEGNSEQERQITLILKDGSRGTVNYRDSFPDGAEAHLYEDVYYPSHQATDFYHEGVIDELLRCGIEPIVTA